MIHYANSLHLRANQPHIYNPNHIEIKQTLLQRANISNWLCGAAYCDKQIYPQMQLSGPAAPFYVAFTIYDVDTDMQGYIGLHHVSATIYVVMRGTASAQNWLEDVQILQTEYKQPLQTDDPDILCKNCYVHTGFYETSQRLAPSVFKELSRLYNIFPYYTFVFTGHSYGAAVVQLLALDFAIIHTTYDIWIRPHQIEVISFGQPRIGNQPFAQWASSMLIQTWRFVHDRDMIPH